MFFKVRSHLEQILRAKIFIFVGVLSILQFIPNNKLELGVFICTPEYNIITRKYNIIIYYWVFQTFINIVFETVFISSAES